MNVCPYEHWAYLSKETRLWLRSLTAYQTRPERMDHLRDQPSCRACRSLHVVAA